MKFPKRISIMGQEWEIRRTRGGGGYFSCDNHFIEIGLDGDDKRQWEIFVHEITEALMADNFLRFQKPYTAPENGDYMFVFDHSAFEILLAKPLAAILWDLIPQ